MDNMHTEVMSKFENDRRERVVQQRWVIGILLTVLLGVGSLVIAVWGKI